MNYNPKQWEVLAGRILVSNNKKRGGGEKGRGGGRRGGGREKEERRVEGREREGREMEAGGEMRGSKNGEGYRR